MTDLEERVVEDAVRDGELIRVPEFVELAERAHADERGVERERVWAYAEAVSDRPEVEFDPGTFRERVRERATDADAWLDDEAVYAIGDRRLSRYPARWHEDLGGSDDVAAYVAYLAETDAAFVNDPSAVEAGPKVPQQRLIAVMAAVGTVDRDEARAALADAREAGEVVQDVDQHPNAGVYLPSESGDVDGGPANPN